MIIMVPHKSIVHPLTPTVRCSCRPFFTADPGDPGADLLPGPDRPLPPCPACSTSRPAGAGATPGRTEGLPADPGTPTAFPGRRLPSVCASLLGGELAALRVPPRPSLGSAARLPSGAPAPAARGGPRLGGRVSGAGGAETLPPELPIAALRSSEAGAGACAASTEVAAEGVGRGGRGVTRDGGTAPGAAAADASLCGGLRGAGAFRMIITLGLYTDLEKKKRT